MNEIIIGCNVESVQEDSVEMIIDILSEPEENLLYKFIAGFDGTWETLKDFGKEKKVIWKPKNQGNYILMVQAKKEDSTKAFDYVSRKIISVGDFSEKLISNIYIDKERISVGEKVTVKVEAKNEFVMFRYLIKENERWVLAKDYCTESSFSWRANSPGKYEILIQCKSLDSDKKFEDAMKVEFEVVGLSKLEITNFKCLSPSLLVDEELLFEVESKCDDSRTILYKFIKISEDGQAKCIQDYSTKKIVSYTEKYSGSYRLLCEAKDMYSNNEYDDRAIIHYKVKPYEPVVIESFTSDLSSPQIVTQKITLKAVARGGKDLRYRFIIEGSKNYDSGYIRSDTYVWDPKQEGHYKISLWVKDISSKEKYEACDEFEFDIDEVPREPIKIKDVIVNKRENVLIGETINVKTIADGGIKPLYKFIIKKDKKEIESIGYRECSCINFTPEEEGRFEIEIRVKDKYSDKEFDAHHIVSIHCYEYIPAKIDYVLMEPREYYLVGDQIVLNTITRDTSNTLLKYVLSINDHKVEETEYVKKKKYILTPKCSGRYIVKVYAKNEKSKKEFDSTKQISLIVNEAPPITNTILKCDRIEFYHNEPITVTAESCGGKDIIYEFYLMEKEEWNLVQRYSKKDYYTFIPFSKGIYKVLVLAKNSHKNVSYEDYCMIEIKVNEKLLSEVAAAQ